MKILGQDVLVLKNQVIALLMNVWAWFLSYLPSRFQPILPPSPRRNEPSCIVIQGPGGIDRLQHISLNGYEYPYNESATVGYNIPNRKPPFVTLTKPYKFNPDLVLVKISHFSINYADICIRWGLYESAIKYVGWPIVPGFDFSGTVIWAGEDTDFEIGENIFGFTMFGAYSSTLLVPARQIRRIPKLLVSSPEKASCIVAVAATALHAISLAGGWPKSPISKNRAALVHSAAGGVGSVLIQMLKICGYFPIVGVVGSSHKIQHVLNLGADNCIVKSSDNPKGFWDEANKISPGGYAAIFDANGVDTLNESYDHLCMCGKLVIYGFHSNLPKGSSLLSPISWMKMIYKMIQMPKYDPMSLVLESKSISGFNLSFFADEHELINSYMTQLIEWIEKGLLKVSDVTVFDIKDTARAHELIQTGNTIGKLCIKVT